MSTNEGNALAQRVRCLASAERSSNGAAISVPRTYALVWSAYGAVVVALDTRAGTGGERIRGAMTWFALFAALRPLPRLARAQTIGVVLFARARLDSQPAVPRPRSLQPHFRAVASAPRAAPCTANSKRR